MIEVVAWQAAGDAGAVELPPELAEFQAEADRIEAERRELGEALGPVNAAELVVAGQAVNEAVVVSEAERAEAERRQAARQAATNALDVARRRVDGYVARNRDRLIELADETARDLVTQARHVAELLARFGPLFEVEHIARRATPAELDEWQTARALDRPLGLILGAVAATWQAATATHQQPDANTAPKYLRPARLGGVHLWRNPAALDGVPDVRDGVAVGVLALAAHADAGDLRLLTCAEAHELDRRYRLERPWVAGERRRRPVFIIAGEHPRPSSASRRRRAMSVRGI
jgi:hypothetical protein